MRLMRGRLRLSLAGFAGAGPLSGAICLAMEE
jgi:hypothetical protein